MSPESFVAELDGVVQERLRALRESSAAGTPGPQTSMPALLTAALRNELEATEEAALWLVSEEDVEVKLALARQCGDEAKHYRLIEERLRGLGVDPKSVNPLAGGRSPMFTFLASLKSTVERVAAGQFTREGLAIVRNEVFIEYCDATGDGETARLYREVIAPDELHHHQLGRKLLLRFADSPESQALARAAALRTLELAEELQEAALLKKGLCRLPGC